MVLLKLKMGDDCRAPDEKNATDNRQRPPATTTVKNWFMSLSRQKKDERPSNVGEVERAGSEGDLSKYSRNSRREDKNVFQRFKRKMEKKFASRQRKIANTNSTSGTATNQVATDEDASRRDCPRIMDILSQEKWDQRRYLAKKWLEGDSGPNHVMYNACTEMLSHAWYWGETSRHDAQRQLTGKPNGSFLVRDSESDGPQFTLSFRIANCTLHYRIQHRENFWHFEARQYKSIVDMIEDIMLRNTDDKFLCYVKAPCEMQPPFPVVLKYPISRYSKIAQLQEICRRVIRRYIETDEIEKLPIPVKLKNYLAEDIPMIF